MSGWILSSSLVSDKARMSMLFVLTNWRNSSILLEAVILFILTCAIFNKDVWEGPGFGSTQLADVTNYLVISDDIW